MVRPRQFDPDTVAEALLDVFWSRGYARTSIGDLTAATGLLPGSLYAAYGSKEDMFRAATERYVGQLAAEIATRKRGLAAIEHILNTIVRLTARDPQRRGCVMLNAIPEAHVLSAATQEHLQAGLGEMRALLRVRLREAQADAGTHVDLEPLEALLFAASAAIRVLGRAGQDARLLKNVAKGAMDAARRAFREEE